MQITTLNEAQVPGAMKHDCFPQFGFARDYRSHEVALTAGLTCSIRARTSFRTASWTLMPSRQTLIWNMPRLNWNWRAPVRLPAICRKGGNLAVMELRGRSVPSWTGVSPASRTPAYSSRFTRISIRRMRSSLGGRL